MDKLKLHINLRLDELKKSKSWTIIDNEKRLGRIDELKKLLQYINLEKISRVGIIGYAGFEVQKAICSVEKEIENKVVIVGAGLCAEKENTNKKINNTLLSFDELGTALREMTNRAKFEQYEKERTSSKFHK